MNFNHRNYYHLFIFCAITAMGFSQNSVIPGSIRTHATFEHISVLWEINGDDNFNSTFTLSFRPNGIGSYQAGAPAMRANPISIVNGAALNRNHHAASAMWLDVDTPYELKLELMDPDGGSSTQIISISTQAEWPSTFSGTDRYVIPGNSGGTGSQADPYQGLQTAADAAQAGDVFHIAPGVYNPFTLLISGTSVAPIVFSGSKTDSTIIDGQNTDQGIVTLGKYNDSLGNVLLENFYLRDGHWGVDAQNTYHICIRNNVITEVDDGIVNRRDNNWENNQVISDNIIIGRLNWPVPSGIIPSERGVDLNGSNNVIRYNYISNFGDGITVPAAGGTGSTSYSLDIHNNDIYYTGDDLIEIDGSIANSRVYNNRGINGRMGVSTQPVFGGPVYIFRNVFFNLEKSIFKMNNAPAGLVIVHNSSAKLDRGITAPNGWHNTMVLNNAIASTHYCFELYGLATNSLFDDWNHNAWYTTQAGNGSEPWFKWDDVRYDDLPDLQVNTNIESQGKSFTPSAWSQLIWPTSYENGTTWQNADFILGLNAPMINQGESLPNLNDPYVSDGLPDMGAYERAGTIPKYGPRTNCEAMVSLQDTLIDQSTTIKAKQSIDISNLEISSNQAILTLIAPTVTIAPELTQIFGSQLVIVNADQCR